MYQLKRIKSNDIRKLSLKEQDSKLYELKLAMFNLQSSGGRGTLKKESGSVKSVRRNIARILTIMNDTNSKGVKE